MGIQYSIILSIAAAALPLVMGEVTVSGPPKNHRKYQSNS